MAIRYAYTTPQALTARIAETRSSFTDDYLAAIEAVSQQIVEYTGHRFHTWEGALYFGAIDADCVLLGDEDLYSVTSLRTDDDGDSTYETTWATGDYRLGPVNAPAHGKPYWEVRTRLNSSNAFPSGAEAVEITGKWTWQERLQTLGVLATAVNATLTTGIEVTYGVAQIGQTLRVGSEQWFVTALTTATATSAPDRIDVERGVNGTSGNATSHSSGAAVQLYRYPSAVVRATTIQANRVAQRPNAPFGVIGAADVAQIRLTAALDPDVQRLLDAVDPRRTAR